MTKASLVLRMPLALAAAMIVGLVWATTIPTFAQSLVSFYAGTPLKIVVASGAGGGYDLYARILARFYGNHIPGNPHVIVEDMPGAAGLTATNWAYNAAPRDGSQIVATYSALIDSNLIGNTKALFDVRKFGWIGSIASSPLICFTWHTSPYKDIRQMIGKPLTVSTSGLAAKSGTFPLLLNQILGTQFKVIAGYSTAETTLAVERGEVDAMCGIGLSTLQASNPEWLTDKKVNIVAQIDLSKVDELKDVPNVLDLVTGKDRDMVEYGAILEAMGRPYLAPPGLPAERLAALRKGFDETMKDPAFNAEVEKLHLNVSAMTGDDMAQWIDKLYSFSPDIVERVARLNGDGGN